jgi:uncharacterized protein YneF (UPF0154 family)
MKKRNLLIIVGVAFLIVLVGGGYFLFFSNNTSNKTLTEQPEEVEEEIISKISPEDLGLMLTAGAGNRTVTMEITNLDEVSSLDYELSYKSKGDLPRGIVGNIEVSSKDKQIKKELVLGTCSDVCHYDEDVTDIKIILKVIKTDGTVFHSEQTLET